MLRAVIAALLLAATPALAGDIGVEDAYALSTFPGAPTGAAYMLIRNGGADDRLLAASSPAARAVELHQSEEEDGVVRMRPVEDGLPVPAGGTLDLARGGAHLMFVGLLGPWEDGDLIEVTLTFEAAGDVTLSVPVDLSRLTGEPAHDGHEGHGGDGAAPMGHEGH